MEGHELIGRLRLAASPMQQLHDAGRWQDADERAVVLGSQSARASCSSWTDIVDRYLRWMETLAQPPDSFLRALGDDAVELRRRALHVDAIAADPG